MKKIVLMFACVVSVSVVYAATPETTIHPSIGQISLADSVNLTDYVGKYKMEGLPFDYITIAVKDGQLTVDTGSESGAMTTVKDTPDTFDASGRATLKFKRDTSRKVTGVTLDAQGTSFEGKKES